jgi:nucleoside-diphosphate-sugar epimerase
VKVLVTGAAGKLGSNLTRRLREGGHEVRALLLPNDQYASRVKPFEPEIMEGDFFDEGVADRAVAGVDAVVNLASIGHYAKDDRHFYVTDTVGTYNLLWAARKQQGGLKRFVQASSLVSYGPTLYEPMDETHPQRPNSALGATKLTAEVICNEMQAEHGIPTVRLRFTWVHAGLDFLTYQMRHQGMLGRAKGAAGRNMPGAAEAVARIEGLSDDYVIGARGPSGNTWKSHTVDIRDLVTFIETVLVHPAASGEAFNVASPEPTRYDVAGPYLARALGKQYVEVAMPSEMSVHVSTAKARALLGWQPKHDWFASVDDAVRMERGEDIGVVRL